MYTEGDFKHYESSKKVFVELETRLLDRINEVIDVIAKAFGRNRSHFCWYFSDASEGQTGTPEIDKESVQYCVEAYSGHSYPTMNTHMWSYDQGFPIEFLFMTNQDIADLLEKEINETKAQNEKAKITKTLKEQQKKEKKKQILKKLTPSEKKLLGL